MARSSSAACSAATRHDDYKRIYQWSRRLRIKSTAAATMNKSIPISNATLRAWTRSLSGQIPVVTNPIVQHAVAHANAGQAGIRSIPGYPPSPRRSIAGSSAGTEATTMVAKLRSLLASAASPASSASSAQSKARKASSSTATRCGSTSPDYPARMLTNRNVSDRPSIHTATNRMSHTGGQALDGPVSMAMIAAQDLDRAESQEQEHAEQ
jgi:hypothetical protein